MLSPDPMTFKTNRQPGLLPRLSGISLLGFSGPEVGAFLQAQTMNDVHLLADGQWQWNGWLNPKGRVIALFALLKLHEDEFLAVIPDFPAQELLPLLQRYVFRTKVRLQVVTDLTPAADLESPDDAAVPRDMSTGSRESGLCLNFSGDSVHRHLQLLPETSAMLGPVDAECDVEWFGLDLAHGLPRLVPGQRESWTPQMLSLDRLHAFSLKKGCYPGQEIVARTHYLGQAKRGLCRLLGRELEIGASVHDAQAEAIGSIICASPDATAALAVVQSDKLALAAWAGERPVTVADFLGGLERPV